MTHSTIEIRGAREHNLKNIDVSIERGQLTVITGVSGSGKSSLAFDTILAESRRRFFYTLSHYSRQFLDLASRPAVSMVKGLSPSIFLAQNETPPSRRASVATLTDLGELWGVMFSRFGQNLCPTHHLATSAYSAPMMADQLIREKTGSMVVLCSPIAEAKKGHFKSVLMGLAAKGFLRVWIDGEIRGLEPIPLLSSDKKHTIKLIVDGLRIKPESKSRLLRSIESVLSTSEGYLEWYPTDSQGQLLLDQGGRFSLKGGCPTCGYSWPKLDPRYFAANSLGKCRACSGRGVIVKASEVDSWEESLGENDEGGEGISGKEIQEAHSMVLCSECQGVGLDKNLDSIRLFECSIRDVHGMSFSDLLTYVRKINLDPTLADHPASQRVMSEILPICERIDKIGLGYLTLSRRLHTLSAGELQRLKLAGILGGRLRGILYVLDEPSQGLHPTEVHQIAQTLLELKEDGSTIIVVDHDEGFMRLADWIIDLGPGGGAQGGNVIAKFRPQEAKTYQTVSATARFLAEPVKKNLRKKNHCVSSEADQSIFSSKKPYLELTAGTHQVNNLKIDRCVFPLHGMSAVTGVSGAGKSSLVLDTLFPLLVQLMENQEKNHDRSVKNNQGTALKLVGAPEDFKWGKVELIDRKKIAKSGVSIPASYLDILGDLRDLFAKLPEAQVLGLSARSFSLAVEGGRCKECKGRGVINLKMKFLADALVTCTLCQGRRFTSQVLGVRYQGKTLADFLEMSLGELAELMVHHKKIMAKLAPALALGLGYLKVGQPTSSLSGGEAQRLKLVPFFYQGTGASRKASEHTILVLDEPTTGLHREDVGRLLKVLKDMVAKGTTVIAIEHHDEIIRQADWNIEMGPGSADHGGRIVYQGPLS